MRQLHDKLWVHEDSMKLAGVNLPLRMTVVRLEGGGVWVHSPTELNAELKAAVDALGPISVILAPSNGHNLWLRAWHDAYPDANVYVSAGIPKKLPALGGYLLLDEASDPPWSADLEQQMLRGVPFFDECVFLHKASGSLIVTDLVQNHRGQVHQGFAKVMTKLMLEPMGFKDICIAPPLRFSFVIKDRPAFVESISAVQAWNFERIIVTHGDIIEDNASDTFKRLMQRFTGG